MNKIGRGVTDIVREPRPISKSRKYLTKMNGIIRDISKKVEALAVTYFSNVEDDSILLSQIFIHISDLSNV